MYKALAVILAACALVGVASAAGERACTSGAGQQLNAVAVIGCATTMYRFHTAA